MGGCEDGADALEESRNERGENAGYVGLIGWIAETNRPAVCIPFGR